jgi:hypothetical protein
MGLDMYLSAKKYLWKFDDADVQVSKEIQDKLNLRRRVKEVSIEAMYWRKANQIHSWFVENVQDGIDECKPHHVSREELEELLRTCRAALHHKDSRILPPQEGFFFGSTEVDNDYWDDIKRTAAEIETLLAELDDSWEFEYCASW